MPNKQNNKLKIKNQKNGSKKANTPLFKRPSWDDYFLNVMDVVATRATCDRGRTASIIVKDRHILTTGYVGSAVGQPHCDDVGHDMRQVIDEEGKTSRHCVRTLHAEQNAICQAAKLGVSIEGSTIYMRMEPCSTCAKMIVNAGIKRVVSRKRYHAGQETREILKAAGVSLEVLDDEVLKYERQ